MITCDRCGKTVYRRFGEQDRGTRKLQFCSRKCYMERRKETMKITVYPKSGACHIHRIVAEKLIGRELKAGEVVHHIDGDKHNAAPANLFVFKSQSDHVAYHMRRSK